MGIGHKIKSIQTPDARVTIVKEYAKQDVSLTLRLWKLFDKKIDEVLYTKPENNDQKTCRKIFYTFPYYKFW